MKRLEKVVVIVLNYNGEDITKNCLRSMSLQSVAPGRIVFVDNGSTRFDPTIYRDVFNKQFLDEIPIDFLRLEKNQGYVGGMNHGLKHALKSSAEWVMTLSNDTELDKSFFQELGLALEKMEVEQLKNQKKYGAIAPKVKQLKSKEYLDATGLSICIDGMSSARGQREIDTSQYDSDTNVLMPNGVSAIYNIQALKEVGLLDERFDCYCEDTDLGLRIWLSGKDCQYVPDCLLYHDRSHTLGEFSLKKLYQVERNHYWVMLKNFPSSLIFMNPLFTFYRFILQLFAIVMKKGQGQGYGSYSKKELVITVLKAMKDSFLGIGYCLKLRKNRVLRRNVFQVYNAFFLKNVIKKTNFGLN